MNKIAPYKKVKIGDKIFLKLTGQPVTAIAKVKNVQYFELTPEIVENIRIKYGKQIGTDKFEDWESTLNKKYCTLIWLEDVKKSVQSKFYKKQWCGMDDNRITHNLCNYLTCATRKF